MSLKTNREHLVKMSVQGAAAHPSGSQVRVDSEGHPFVMPAIGGITYNVRLGDPCFGLVGDHVEPGVSMENPNRNENNAFMVFSCFGNKARVITGDAKGDVGFVTGKHGGVEHVMACFDEDTLYKMVIGDQILVEAYGQGLKLLDYPDIKVQSLDPDILENMGIEEKDGKLVVPVVATVPAHLMGSGIGDLNCYTGDYDLMTIDRQEIAQLGLDKLRFGDFVFLQDCDNTYGRGYLHDAVSIGMVIHSDCIVSGHGPGISTVLACKTSMMVPKIDPEANLLKYHKIAMEKQKR